MRTPTNTPTGAVTRKAHRRADGRRGRKLAGLVLAGTLTLAGCTSNARQASPPSSGNAGGTVAGGAVAVALPNLQLASALEPFAACDQFLDYVKKAAIERVGPYGLPGTGVPGDRVFSEDSSSGRTTNGGAVPQTATPNTTTAASGAPAPSGEKQSSDSPTNYDESAGQGTSGTPEHSETNVQEKGVDEPDTVKTDGVRILTVNGNRLNNIDVRGPAPVAAGSIALPGNGNTQLLVSGNHVLAIAPDTSNIAARRSDSRSFQPQPASTLLSIIDVTDPKTMKVLHSVRVDGTFVSARMVDGQARVVTSSGAAALAFVYPSASTAAAENAAEEANKRIINDSKIEDWLPNIRIGETVTPTVKPLLDCTKVSHPKTFSGFGTVAVISVDVSANEVNPADAVGVMADGQTVYASKESLYVATPAYVEPAELPRGSGDVPAPRPRPQALKATTSLHKFSIAAKGPAVYRASGDVEGSLLNQYSMSDEAGTLRVATTTGAASCQGCANVETFVKVLQEADGELKQVGSIGNMGHGEQVKAVRFVGAQGYVVTFRQTDPLYTLDLADPTSPKVVGELKLLGYSAYLHPVGDRMIIGIGQDATATGRTTGTKVALYDMADLANPRELQSYVNWNSTSDVEQDFHAFMWWEPSKLAVLPVDRGYVGYIGGQCTGANQPCTGQAYVPPFTGAIGLVVDRDAIRELGRIVNPGGVGRTPTPCPTGVTDSCESPCPPDAMCTTNAGGAGGEPMDCTKTPCTAPANKVPIPVTTVPCGPAGDCRTSPPIPPEQTAVGAPIDRTLVVGDTLYSFSANGVKSSELSTLNEKYWLPLR